jgi:hypothetical protein
MREPEDDEPNANAKAPAHHQAEWEARSTAVFIRRMKQLASVQPEAGETDGRKRAAESYCDRLVEVHALTIGRATTTAKALRRAGDLALVKFPHSMSSSPGGGVR